MKRSLFAVLLFASIIVGDANVVRPAPPFSWAGPGGKAVGLASVRGQPVVLLLAKSPDHGAFRKQAQRLRSLYYQFAARKVIFAAAFAEEGDGRIQSDIPFVVVNNGPGVISAYDAQDDFKLVVIGTDGNLDLQTSRVCPAERVRDVITNSFAAQTKVRR